MDNLNESKFRKKAIHWLKHVQFSKSQNTGTKLNLSMGKGMEICAVFVSYILKKSVSRSFKSIVVSILLLFKT